MKNTVDLTIFNQFDFKFKPIALKFLLFKPEGIRKLDKPLALCEMMREAQQTEPFFAGLDNFNCVGPILFGMAESDAVFEAGHIGESLHIFEEARANRRLYYYLTKLERNSINYVAFSSLDKISFTPDILILATDGSQLEIILRAMCFATGKMWNSKGTPVIACNWLTTYPYISGEVNFFLTDVSHGMKAKELFPAGTILISIPYDQIHNIVDGLKKIEWVPALYTEGREAHDRKFEEAARSLHQKLESQQGSQT
ncbi:MAG TPA: DUF169 domain-containing protein [Dehalococcoidales bacterium]|nr:DUF169 domain-containing protein [Dehalococcoidales bacterium]